MEDPTKKINSNPNSSGDDDHHHRSRTRNKPRGRPHGSKNKPKPPIIISRESPNTFTSHFMEVPPAHDIIQALSTFAANKQRGLCILTATGTVANLTLRQPPGVLTLPGTFHILSMSGAFLPPPAPPPASGLSVFLAGRQGQVVGGKVVGPLLAAGLVVVAAASFANSPYDRLPLTEDDREIEDEDEKNQALTSLIPTATAAAAALPRGFGNNAHRDVIGADEFWAGRPPI